MITVADVEYKSFEDVSNIQDEGLRDQVVKAWAKDEIEQKKIKSEGKKPEPTEEEIKAQEKIVADEQQQQQIETDRIAAEEEEARIAKENEGLSEEEIKAKELAAKELADKEAADKAARESDTGKTDAEIKAKAEEDERLARENDTKAKLSEEEVKAQEERVKVYAQKHSLDVDVAREKLGKLDNYKGKYQGDIDEIAHAALSAQAQLSQIHENIRQSQATQQNPWQWQEDHVIVNGMKDGKVVGERVERDEVINTFRKNNVDSTKNLEDDAVWQLAILDNKNWFKGQVKDRNANMGKESEKRINTFIANIPEKDKRFLEDFKTGVAGLSPADVLSSPDALLTTLNLVKGITADEREDSLRKEIEVARAEGFERGKKQSVILGEESGKPEGKGGDGGDGEKKLDWDPTPKEKKDAIAYFADHPIPDEDKIKTYKDIALLKRKNKKK